MTQPRLPQTPSDAEVYLETILEGIGEGFYAVDANWRITRFNSQAARHFARRPDEVIGRNLWHVFPGARETDLGRVFVEAMARREPAEGEALSVVMQGRSLAYRLFALADGLGVVFRDITDHKRAQEQRDLLVGELRHRVNNTLATVQAIASQTFRNTAKYGIFAGRLRALSNAHSALGREDWESTPLHSLVISALGPHAGPGRERFSVRGPDIPIQPKSAVALSMAIHELCTNAAKYGALSRESGGVAIEWAVGDDRFKFRWAEHGGPLVSPPSRKGFGSTMIERALGGQGAEARIEYRAEGIVCTIDAPLEAIRD